MEFVHIIVFALLAESIWETLKMIWQNGKISIDKIGALVIGIGLAVVGNLDLFEMLDISLGVPVVGMACTGILISRGSNWIHDLIQKIAGLKNGEEFREDIYEFDADIDEGTEEKIGLSE